MGYPANYVTGCTGERSIFMGMDLRNLKPECALGETPPIEKELLLGNTVYRVGDLLNAMSKPSQPKKPSETATKDQIKKYEKAMDVYYKKYDVYANANKFDLILNMMMRDGVIDYDTKIKVGSDGRLREVFLVKEKEAYRIFGKSYYGKVSK